MIYTEHKITLDIHQTASAVSLRVKKGDTARRLLIHLAERGRPYHISADCYAAFTAAKPDGKVVFNKCTLDGCEIIYDLTEQTVAAAGMMPCEIILYGGNGKQLTSASFQLFVEDTVYDKEKEIESNSEFNALADLIAKAQAVIGLGALAPAIVCEAKGEQIRLTDASNHGLQGLRIFGKSTQDGTPTPDNPVEIVSVGDSGSVKAKVLGKNIVSDLEYSGSSKDYGTLLKSNDTRAVIKGKVYTISITLTAAAETKAYWNSACGFFAQSEQFTVAAGTKRYSKTFTALIDGDTGTAKILLSKASGGDSVAITPANCQIEQGAAVTDYEITEQSVVVSTTKGLRGIPVAMGGNYTDGNGQQWICDEVDFSRGVYVQRIAAIDLSLLTSWARGTGNGWANASAFHSSDAVPKAVPVEGYDTKANILCNRLAIEAPGRIAGKIVNSVGQGMGASIYVSIEGVETAAELMAYLRENKTIVQYALAEPIETPLAAAEIAAFAALHTYKPNTCIHTDVGAYMAAEYVADTKIYIGRNGGGAGSAVSISEVTILADAWIGDAAPYSQVVVIDGVTEYSQVDLNPSVEQLAVFYEKDLAFVTENDGGIVTVYAIGDKPKNDYTMQVTITEVNV